MAKLDYQRAFIEIIIIDYFVYYEDAEKFDFQIK